MISPARSARIAAFAALLASAGDLLLLYVANSRRSELGLPEAGLGWLWLGGALGVVAIPCYALGYQCAARIVSSASHRAARVLFAAGAIIGLLGSAIHGLTAARIGAQLDAPASASDPLTSLMAGDPLLQALWGIATIAVIVASGIFLWFVARGATAAPRAAALANPAFVTLVLAAVGLPSLLLRSFLTPAAPNLAHLVFFLVCARVAHALASRGEQRAAAGPPA